MLRVGVASAVLFLFALFVYRRPLPSPRKDLSIPPRPRASPPTRSFGISPTKEKEFQGARDQYTYRQDVRVITPDDNGEYHEIFDVLFDDQGKRLENVVFAPQSSLSHDLDVAGRR